MGCSVNTCSTVVSPWAAGKYLLHCDLLCSCRGISALAPGASSSLLASYFSHLGVTGLFLTLFPSLLTAMQCFALS